VSIAVLFQLVLDVTVRVCWEQPTNDSGSVQSMANTRQASWLAGSCDAEHDSCSASSVRGHSRNTDFATCSGYSMDDTWQVSVPLPGTYGEGVALAFW
jgi:hypothetical protein